MTKDYFYMKNDFLTTDAPPYTPININILIIYNFLILKIILIFCILLIFLLKRIFF